MSSTIFISMPSLDDDELIPTVLDAFEKAENPNLIFFGIHLLSKNKKKYYDFKKATKKYKKQISISFSKITLFNVFDQLGVGLGRSKSAKHYAEQDYFLQIDSHTWFREKWDTFLINLFEEARKELDLSKFILTGYAGCYSYIGSRRREPDKEHGYIRYPFFVKNSNFNSIVPSWKDTTFDKSDKKFIPCTKFNANFSFGDKEFANYSGVEESFVFAEEEILQSINLYGAGFSFVFPNIKEPIICHLYSNYKNSFGGKRFAISEYLDKKSADILDGIAIENIYKYLSNKNNFEKIVKYQNYAKIRLLDRSMVEWNIPDTF